MRRRVAIASIVLTSAGASDAACNAILGNDVHELARRGTDGAAATPDAAMDDASDADTTASDAVAAVGGDDVSSSADAGDSQANSQDAPDGRSFDASDATVDGATREASDADADAMHDAAACANGIGSLSNIGTRDFHISFRILTTQVGWVALVNQRSVCNVGLAFWDIRLCMPGADNCLAEGAILFETDNNDTASYQTLSSQSPVNDGKAHEVLVARTAGMLTIQIDGNTQASLTPSVASFGNTLPALRIGTDVCIGAPNGDPTVALTGTLSDLCITSP